MTYTISNKDELLQNFLVPISKIADSAVLSFTPGAISCLVTTSDNTVIMSAVYKDAGIKFETNLNIPDIKKLCRILQCIELQTFNLKIDSNNISYTSNTVRFKYHLYDDNIISTPKINITKLNSLEFDSTFNLTLPTVLSLIKGSTIASETNKIYITTNSNKLFGELTDKTRPNTDSYGVEISDTYDGTQLTAPIPLNFEIFRIISSMKFNTIKGKIVTALGVITFELQHPSVDIKFIVSALAS